MWIRINYFQEIGKVDEHTKWIVIKIKTNLVGWVFVHQFSVNHYLNGKSLPQNIHLYNRDHKRKTIWNKWTGMPWEQFSVKWILTIFFFICTNCCRQMDAFILRKKILNVRKVRKRISIKIVSLYTWLSNLLTPTYLFFVKFSTLFRKYMRGVGGRGMIWLIIRVVIMLSLTSSQDLPQYSSRIITMGIYLGSSCLDRAVNLR